MEGAKAVARGNFGNKTHCKSDIPHSAGHTMLTSGSVTKGGLLILIQ